MFCSFKRFEFRYCYLSQSVGIRKIQYDSFTHQLAGKSCSQEPGRNI